MKTVTVLFFVLLVGCTGLAGFGLASEHRVRWGEIARADRLAFQPTAKIEPVYVAKTDHEVWQYFHDRGRDFNQRDWEVVTWYAHLSGADRRRVDAEMDADDAYETRLPYTTLSPQPMADVWPSMALSPAPLYPIVPQPGYYSHREYTCNAYQLGRSSSSTNCL